MTPDSEKQRVVLVVENNPQVLELLGDMVADRGWEAVSTTSLKGALASFASRSIDAIIADVELDDGNSIPLLIKAHESPHPIPTFAISSYASDALRQEILRLGAIDLLAKPFRLDALASRLSQQFDAAATVM